MRRWTLTLTLTLTLTRVSAEQHPLPFHCPFDHLFDLDKWVHSDAPMREYSFLDNPQVKG